MRDGLGRVGTVLVLGGTSEIGTAIAAALVERGAGTVVLAGRDAEGLGRAAAHLHALGAGEVATVPLDARDRDGHADAVGAVFDRFGDVDVVVHAIGVLGDQARDERDGAAAAAVVDVNFTGAVTMLVPAAERLVAQGHGALVVLSSVAGQRARRSNYVYGASKAGLDAFVSGMAPRLAGSGVDVVVVRPGFVRGRMTAGRDPAPLATTPEAVAAATVRALERGREEVWVPPAMRLVAAVARHLPRPVFRRVPL